MCSLSRFPNAAADPRKCGGNARVDSPLEEGNNFERNGCLKALHYEHVQYSKGKTKVHKRRHKSNTRPLPQFCMKTTSTVAYLVAH